MSYKEEQGLDKQFNAEEIEKRCDAYWSANEVYKYDATQSRDNSFVIDTPPPTVSGSLHIGHIFSYTQTDIIARYQRMQGKSVFYPIGWDDNGSRPNAAFKTIITSPATRKLPMTRHLNRFM